MTQINLLEQQNIPDKTSLTDFINQVKNAFDDFVWFKSTIIECEIKSIKKVRQFYYLELIELDSFGRVLSSARANIFNPIVIDSFLRRAKIINYNDIVWTKILINAWPTFHKDFWFSINIDKIFTESFVWNVQIQKEDIIKELKEKWILYQNKEHLIWYPSYKIALISSSTSEWLRDFLSILEESNINFEYDLFETKVWWNDAKDEVLSSLNKIENIEYDFVFIVRWWWASDWMYWWNDRILSQKVCEFNKPIITAVGHTVDESILDLVCFKSCKTPSEAASYFINLYLENKQNLSYSFEMINYKIDNKINFYRFELEKINNFISKINLKLLNYKNEIDKTILNIRWHSLDKILSRWYFYLKSNSWEFKKELEIWETIKLVWDKNEYIIEVKEKNSI